jgi:hypothetical protein
MWKANGKTTTLQLFLDSLSKNTQIGRGYGPVERQKWIIIRISCVKRPSSAMKTGKIVPCG